MRKHKRIFAILIALILLISGIGISGTGAAEAAARSHPVSEINTQENFNQIRGHDAKHPIWAHNSLGVVVTNNDPKFLADVRKACAAWSPVFRFHDYGYVNLARKKINTRKNKLNFVYVSEANTSWANDGKPGDRTLGIEQGADFANVTKKGHYFKPAPVYIDIDTKAITYGFGARGLNANDYVIYALEHEFGHAIGLRHSTDRNDLMYPVLNSEVKPVDLAVVKRLYRNVSPVAYPKRLSFISKNNFYLSKQNIPQLAGTIDSHFYAVNNKQQSSPCGGVGFAFDFYRYRKGHGYKHFKRTKLPNGIYKVRFSDVKVYIMPQNRLQRYHLNLGSLENAGIGYVPRNTFVHYCHSFTVKPRRSTNTHKFSFTIKVKVRNHHFYVLKK